MKKLFLTLFALLIAFSAHGRMLVPSRQVSIEERITNQLIVGDTLLEVLENLTDQVGAIATTAVVEASTNYYPSQGNPSNFISEADLTNGLSGLTNVFYLNSNPSNFITLADIPAAIAGGSRGYLKGVVPQFVDSDTISVSPGTLTSRGTNTFVIESAVLVELATLLVSVSGREILYVYHDATSDPDSFYAAADEPVDASDGTGWYHPSNTDDRHVGSVRVNSSGNSVIQFATVGDDTAYEHFIFSERQLWDLNSVTPSIWTPPNVSGASINDMIPVAATEVYVQWYTEDTGGYSVTTEATFLGSRATGASSGGSASTGRGIVWVAAANGGRDHLADSGWVPLSLNKGSRNVFLAWDKNNVNIYQGSIFRWRVTR